MVPVSIYWNSWRITSARVAICLCHCLLEQIFSVLLQLDEWQWRIKWTQILVEEWLDRCNMSPYALWEWHQTSRTELSSNEQSVLTLAALLLNLTHPLACGKYWGKKSESGYDPSHLCLASATRTLKAQQLGCGAIQVSECVALYPLRPKSGYPEKDFWVPCELCRSTG